MEMTKKTNPYCLLLLSLLLLARIHDCIGARKRVSWVFSRRIIIFGWRARAFAAWYFCTVMLWAMCECVHAFSLEKLSPFTLRSFIYYKRWLWCQIRIRWIVFAQPKCIWSPTIGMLMFSFRFLLLLLLKLQLVNFSLWNVEINCNEKKNFL